MGVCSRRFSIPTNSLTRLGPVSDSLVRAKKMLFLQNILCGCVKNVVHKGVVLGIKY